MNLTNTLIRDTFAETLAKIAIIEAHAGQLAECEALAERIAEAAPALDGKPVAHVSVHNDSLTTRVLIIAVRESELRAALAAADLRIERIEHDSPTAMGMRVTLAGGIDTVIDVIVKADELPGRMPPPNSFPPAAPSAKNTSVTMSSGTRRAPTTPFEQPSYKDNIMIINVIAEGAEAMKEAA